MPTKKKVDKGEGRSRNSSAGKGESKAAPVEASQASAGESTRATEASEKRNTTSASKRTRSASAEKPRAKQDATAKASTRGARRRVDPVSAVLSDAPPTREQIAVRAYELFVKSGYQDGHSEEHWLQAERELKREYAAKKRAPRRPRPTFSSV
jgi:hypothetical protein